MRMSVLRPGVSGARGPCDKCQPRGCRGGIGVAEVDGRGLGLENFGVGVLQRAWTAFIMSFP